MNDIDQKNNNDDQLSGDIESININSNTATNENTQTSEKKDIEFLVKDQTTDFGTFPINQDKNMSTNFDNKLVKNELNDIDSASVVQSVGHLLRRARMARGMSIDDVSRQLRLSAQQIEAIEKEDFEKLPGRTFLRGFIRNYANLVQLDSIPLLQLLPESAPVISTYERTPFKNKQISFSSNREGSGNNQLVIVIVLFIIILGIYFIFENNSWNKESDNNYVDNEVKVDSETTSVEIQLPLSTNVKNAVDPQANKISETSNQINNQKNSEVEPNVKTEAIQTEIKPIVKGVENSTTTTSDLGNLHFKFAADSWIKVIDATGAALLEQIKTAGTEQIITGKRPLSIVIGNASGVNLTYNDNAIDILSYRRQDGTARFTLE